MSEFEMIILAQFVNDHWTSFVQHCKNLDLSEDEAEQIVKKLEGEA